MARAALEETRRSVLEMRSSALEASSLAESVARELRSLERAGIATRAIVTGEPGHLTSEMETALLRIMQEAVANTRKHAAASRVEASLEYGTESVTLSIVDDGNGFEPEAASRSPGNTGFGLIGMSERAALLAGSSSLFPLLERALAYALVCHIEIHKPRQDSLEPWKPRKQIKLKPRRFVF